MLDWLHGYLATLAPNEASRTVVTLVMRITLSPFADEQAAEIASWPRSGFEAQAWAGRGTRFPVEPDQFGRWHDDPDVHAFIAKRDGDLLAYGEVWVDRAEQEVELARIIVNPAHRNIGVGRKFVTALVEHAATYGLASLFMRVAPDNDRAIHCYEAAGFARVSASDHAAFNQGQPVEYEWLRHGCG
jgi:ribosomal protein S18 acetylase RimI-like enzyme